METNRPEGLLYLPDALSADVVTQANAFLQHLDDESKFVPLSASPHSRMVVHFGYAYDYVSATTKNKIDAIPDALLPLRDVCARVANKDANYFDQCIVNRYEPDQGIGEHRDSLSFGDTIACCTFGSRRQIDFIDRKRKKFTLTTDVNSVYIMRGQARYEWKHLMRARQKDGDFVRQRVYSVTFRHVQ